MWESVNDTFDVCQCSRLMDDCKVTDKCNSLCHISCNKENQLGSPLKHDPELSLYDGVGSASEYGRNALGNRQPFGEHDLNSQDSGYGASSTFSTEESSNLASFGSLDSLNDAFLDFSDMGPLDENTQLPGDFSKLISGKIQCTFGKSKSPQETVRRRPPYRTSISLNSDDRTPSTSKARSCLFKTDFHTPPFKRSDPPTSSRSPSKLKRLKFIEDETLVAKVPSKPTLQKCFSVSEETIKSALQRSSLEPDLIGDFSKAFSLPLISGRHQDLKSISSTTLAMLMRGSFDDKIASYKVIDCRYPYEYEGGHINGAQNIYTKEQILEELLDTDKLPPPQDDSSKRHILIFHCEFSSERGPNLYRFLRNLDRMRNNDAYPALHYPEMYLLDGGYKKFYEQFSDLCTPEAYKPMLHPEHQNDLRHFRAKAKSWNAGTKGQMPIKFSATKGRMFI